MITGKRELKNVPIADLIPYARNPRKNDPAVQRAAATLKEYGLVKNSIVVDEEMVLITGHTTTKAMQSLKWEAAPEVTQVFGLTEAQKKAYRIADNKLGELAAWDEELLALEFEDLKGLDFDVDLTGFDTKELAKILDAEKEATDDDFEPPATVETDIQRGDLFTLGRHRLLCGDSTSAEDVGRLMEGKKAEICFTSPPYNLGKSVGMRNGARKGAKSAYNDDADCSDSWPDLMRSFITNAMRSSVCVLVNVQMLAGNKDALLRILGEYADHTIDLAVWVKSNPPPAMADGVMTSAFEFVWFLSEEVRPTRRILTANFSRGNLSNVYEHAIASGHDASVHGAVFPIPVASHFVEACSPPLAAVLDPFLGSGTTLIACEQLGRTCYGMEISPQYCQVIIDRWEKLTGQKAERVDGN